MPVNAIPRVDAFALSAAHESAERDGNGRGYQRARKEKPPAPAETPEAAAQTPAPVPAPAETSQMVDSETTLRLLERGAQPRPPAAARFHRRKIDGGKLDRSA